MPSKVVLDRRGELHERAFYEFNVQLDDDLFGYRLKPGAIVAKRTPTDDELCAKKEDSYLYISPATAEEDWIYTKDCPVDREHVSHVYSRKTWAETFGGSRVAPLIPTHGCDSFAVSSDLHRRLAGLKVRGAHLHEFDLQDHTTGKKLRGFWSLQFVGKVKVRPPKLVDTPNVCPLCGKGKLICEGCGYIYGSCTVCRKGVFVLDREHGGKDDKRLPVEDGCFGGVLEGRTWDGSDLVQATYGTRSYASKRFLDWLLRIHAAPFYAEPVLFAVDGMSEEQQKWLKELETPLEG